MAGTLLNAGDEIDVVVKSAKPFGLFVESDSGVQGLVHRGSAAVGATVRVRVIEFDAAESRFSAMSSTDKLARSGYTRQPGQPWMIGCCATSAKQIPNSGIHDKPVGTIRGALLPFIAVGRPAPIQHDVDCNGAPSADRRGADC